MDSVDDTTRTATPPPDLEKAIYLVDKNDPDLTDAWRAVLDNVQPNQRAWLASCDPVTVHDDLAIIAVPDDFTRTQVEGRLRAELESALRQVYGREIRLGTTVNPALAGDPAPERQSSAPHPSQEVISSIEPQVDMSTFGLAPVDRKSVV